MSTFEDYSAVAATYDDCRYPLGADVQAAFIISSQLGGGLCNSLSDIDILDAGCGTGNYATRFLTKHHLTSLTLLDANDDMLACARIKIDGLSRKNVHVRYKSGVLPRFPFPPSSFNAIVMNYVLHHLEAAVRESSAHGYIVSKEALTNAAACLKPGGMLAILTGTPHQFRNSVWFLSNEIVPDHAFQDMDMKLMPVKMIAEYLEEQLGFTDVQVLATMNECAVSREALNDIDAPFKEHIIRSISMYRRLSREEMQEMVDKILRMKADGTYSDFVSRRKRCGEICGTATLIFARKSI